MLLDEKESFVQFDSLLIQKEFSFKFSDNKYHFKVKFKTEFASTPEVTLYSNGANITIPAKRIQEIPFEKLNLTIVPMINDISRSGFTVSIEKDQLEYIDKFSLHYVACLN